MDRRAIALFASTVLVISATIPPRAREAEGTVVAIDHTASLITLDDGIRYVLPDTHDYAPLQPGMQVHLLYLA